MVLQALFQPSVVQAVVFAGLFLDLPWSLFIGTIQNCERLLHFAEVLNPTHIDWLVDYLAAKFATILKHAIQLA